MRYRQGSGSLCSWSPTACPTRSLPSRQYRPVPQRSAPSLPHHNGPQSTTNSVSGSEPGQLAHWQVCGHPDAPSPSSPNRRRISPQPHRPGGHFHLITCSTPTCPEELVRRILLTYQNEIYPRVYGELRLSPPRQQKRRDRKFYSASCKLNTAHTLTLSAVWPYTVGTTAVTLFHHSVVIQLSGESRPLVGEKA